MRLISILEDQSSPQELVFLFLFCLFRCFPRHPVLIYPGTHKIHVSFIEALPLIQQVRHLSLMLPKGILLSLNMQAVHAAIHRVLTGAR
jgi:hypothetical protein